MCPAVPTITLFIAVDMIRMGEQSCRFGCYWRKESVVKLQKLFRGGDFVDDGLRSHTRIGRGENGPADDQTSGARANRFRGSCLPGLIFSFRFPRRILWGHARLRVHEFR